MNLMIMRHGEAASMAPSDDVRPLTEYGRKQVLDAASALQRKAVEADLVLASPLLRAQQTAAEVCAVLPFLGETLVETSELLKPESIPTDILDFLNSRNHNCVLLVSHQPLVSLLIEYLTGDQIAMRTANIVSVKVDVLERHQGVVQWVI